MNEHPGEAAQEGQEAIRSLLDSQGTATVVLTSDANTVLCDRERFHWNGSELVVCSLETAPWSGFQGVEVTVSLAADDLHFEFTGGGSTDRVVGVAPEYRAVLVRYLGPEKGHAEADSVGRSADTHRLFITPRWEVAADSDRGGLAEPTAGDPVRTCCG